GRDLEPDLNTPSGVVVAYALAVQRQDHVTAWNLLSSSLKARNTRESFLARPAVVENLALNTDNEQIDGDTARVTLIRTYPARGLFGDFQHQTHDNVVLVRESD